MTKPFHITLIKPNIGRMTHGLYVDEGRMAPLQLGILAALTPPDVELALYDDRMEPIPFDAPTDLVAITVETFTARRAYEISAAYRKRSVPVILGGIHPTLLPEEAARFADSIFLGDAERLWHEVVTDARHGNLQPVYKSAPGPPQPGVITRRDIFKGKGYLPITLLQFSRGCRFACTFCAVSAYFERTQHLREIVETVAEIRSSTGAPYFFVDDNILANHDAAKALFRALIPLNIRWVSQGSIDMTRDPELMRLMVKSGCLGNVIGFESIDPGSLAMMRKVPNLAGRFDGYEREIEILRDHGLQTWAAFTLGHDGDTRETIERTCEFAVRHKFCFAAFNILMPYPGTPLYRRLARENRLLYDGRWWLHPDYRFNHAAFIPANLSPDALTDACFEARARFNAIGSIIRRALDFKTNMRTPYRFGIYLSYTPLFRRETFKKQGMRLGVD